MSFNPEKLNIKDLTIEEPESKVDLPFDAERDITEKDWEGMKKELERYRNEKDWIFFANLAEDIKVLNPETNLDLSDDDWKNIINVLKASRHPNKDIGKDPWWAFSMIARSAKSLDPKLELGLDDDFWKEMKQDLSDFKRKSNWFDFTDRLIALKVMHPEVNINPSQKEWELMRKQLDEFRANESYWQEFINLAARMKILGYSQDLKLDEKLWQKMRNQLNGYRDTESDKSKNTYNNFAGQWDEQFRRLVEEKSEENQRAIKETEEAIARGHVEAQIEIPQNSPEDIRRETVKRYMDGLGLNAENLKGKRILDLGSGEGEFVEQLTQENISQEAYGMDANLDEASVKGELKSRLLKGDFQKELPVKNLDYVISVGAVSNAIWGGEEVQEAEAIIKNALDALSENGEVRIYPIQEATKDSALEGIKESHKKWVDLLERMSKAEGIKYNLEPRAIKVIGKNNDVILESVLVIKKKHHGENK